MLDSFIKYIEENKLLKSNNRVLLAVSGGTDSMVMAHLFITAGIETAIAHCNFSLRGAESDKDEELVRKYAAENNIPCFTKRFDTKSFAKIKGISIQMAARELRYSWFEEVRKTNNFDSVAVAHNLNDNIETILINLTRGTGIKGLTGMRPATNRIIRPLLFATRERISLYCHENQIPFREDRSNIETKYSRNKIRHLVMPVLKEINPLAEISINETAHKLEGINEIVIDFLQTIQGKISAVDGPDTIFNIRRLNVYMKNKTILFELFKPFGISASTTTDLIRIINGTTGSQVFTTTHRILKNRDQLIVTPLKKSEELCVQIKDISVLNSVPFIRSAEFVNLSTAYKIPAEKNIAFIDAEKATFPMVIRHWQPGDSFYPLGMDQSKKLSDYFIDRKYSLYEKENILILESSGKIVWIIAERIDNRFKITSQSVKALRIETTCASKI